MPEILRRDQAIDHASKYLMETFNLAETEARERAIALLARLSELGDLVQPTARRWVILLRGVLAVAIGLLFLFLPGSALLVVILSFGAWVLADSALAIAAAIENRGAEWRQWVTGVAGLAVGVLALFRPGLTARVFLIAASIWAIVRGLSELSAGIRRGSANSDGLQILSGLVSLAFGVLLFIPGVGATLLIWMIATYAIAEGLLLVGLSLRARPWEH